MSAAFYNVKLFMQIAFTHYEVVETLTVISVIYFCYLFLYIYIYVTYICIYIRAGQVNTLLSL